MARSDADHLEQLKLARDAVVDGLASGQSLVSYTIAGRVKMVEPSSKLLAQLEDAIERVEAKSTARSTSPFRLAKLNRPSRMG